MHQIKRCSGGCIRYRVRRDHVVPGRINQSFERKEMEATVRHNYQTDSRRSLGDALKKNGIEAASFLLRRPFSIHQASRRGGWAGTLEVVFDVVGRGTAWLAEAKPHDTLDVIGPLYATLYLNPWYRLLGAKLGRRAEVSTASFISPDLLTVGEESFIADAVSLGAARVEGGRGMYDRVVPCRPGESLHLALRGERIEPIPYEEVMR